ncbi:1-acyl-sn-glycerol-3-phosphate acyltransferase [filamentous cyanobacterium LEGE 11480]|uniref:1-acyl-sn-glycerol-3-phosphate acyltransferase n=1 Tax=Romeriopsis navalis LEGE 11480 TaxID=2777977 RepID=A0A928VIX6_9CYAN|nr:1-acyl-sn-glycerol-3-phosphate acyltransferase [Romeriopsis navalis LEGE 11480]
MREAQPALGFIAPDYNATVTRAVHWAVPFWMRQTTDLQQVEAKHLETLVQAYEQFEAGKIRLVLAFRHPSVNDPLALGYLFSQLMPPAAKDLGIKLRTPIHSHFMYDRGVPLWAGEIMGWLFSRLGGTSIMRGKLDRAGLKSARNLLLNGQLPFMAAPEGATNGHSEIVAPLEPGIAQLAFWCAEDLAKAQRSEQVVIIPIGLQYKYQHDAWPNIEALLTDLEAQVGIVSPDQGKVEQPLMYARLAQLGEQILHLMEQHYSQFYHLKLATIDPALPPSQQFAQRLQQLLQTALSVPEAYFNVTPKGSMTDRCRRLEQCAWDNIYRQDVDLDHLSVIERSLADRVATESEMHLWHMRLVERFVSVTGSYVREKPTIERFAETMSITWETVARLGGESSSLKRPKIGQQTATVTIGDPIIVSDRLAQYQTNRRQAKQSVETLTQELQTILEDMIV